MDTGVYLIDRCQEISITEDIIIPLHMKYSIEINAPVNKVVELFMDPDLYKEWKKDFLSYERISGNPGQVGAVTKLNFKRVTMFETITSSKLPNEISGTYEHKRGEKTMMIHKSTNRFSAIPGNKTLYEQESELTKVVGFIPKLIMGLMSGAAKKYYQNQLSLFKATVEKH